MCTPVNSATIVGPLTKAYAASVITTWSAMPEQQRGAGDGRPVDDEDRSAPRPEQSVRALAARPQPWRAAKPSTMSAPLERSTPTSGRPFARAVTAACFEHATTNRLTARPCGRRRRPRPTPRGDRRDVARRSARGRDAGHLGCASATSTIGRAARPERLDSSRPSGKASAPTWTPGCVGALRGDDLAQHVEQGPRGWRRGGSAALHPADDPAGQFGHRDPLEVALQPAGHRGGRHDRRPEALERERGEQADAVDLDLGRSARRPTVAAARSMTRRSAVPRGGSSRGSPASAARGSVSCCARGCRRWTSSTRSSANSGSTVTSGSSTGRCTMAASSCWASRRGMQAGGVALVDGDAHAGVRLAELGEQLGQQPAGGGADDAERGLRRAPRRRARPCRRRCRRVRAAPAGPARPRPTPSSVSPPRWRSTRTTPSSVSRRAMWPLTLDCTVYSARAAAENEP